MIFHFENKRKIICFNKNSEKLFERDLKIHSNGKTKFKTIIVLERKNNKFESFTCLCNVFLIANIYFHSLIIFR